MPVRHLVCPPGLSSVLDPLMLAVLCTLWPHPGPSGFPPGASLAPFSVLCAGSSWGQLGPFLLAEA